MQMVFLTVACAVWLLCGCGSQSTSESTSAEKWKEGGLYSTPNENGSYSILKVLKVDERGVHVRLYSNQFPTRPDDVDVDALYMAGMDRKPNESLGMGHLPVSKQSFLTWEARYIKTVPVKEEELEGYKTWLEAKGGYF